MDKNNYLPAINGGLYNSYNKQEQANTSNGNGTLEWHRPNHFSIYVYKNGDEYDPGTKVGVTRTQMPHWISLLDYLTSRLNLVDGSVQHIYTLDGQEIRHFRYFENNGKYVAAHGRFRKRNYGGQKAKKPPFGVQTALYEDNNDGGRLGIYADEGLRHYLRQRDFEPTLTDIWDNTHFDLKAKRDRLIRNDEGAYTKEAHQIRNANGVYNGNNTMKSIGARQTRTEGLAASTMSRLNRSQSVNNVARQRLPPYDQSQSNSAEANLVNGNRKSGKVRQLPQSESEQDFRAFSGNGYRRGDRSRIPTLDTRSRNAGRTPGPGNRNFENNDGAYDIYEMSNGIRSLGRGTKSINGRARSISNGRNLVKNEEEADEIERAEEEEKVVNELMEETGASRDEAEAAVVEAETKLAFENANLQPPQRADDLESPRWATELTTAVRELAGEVHHLHPPLSTETERGFRGGRKKTKQKWSVYRKTNL